MTTAHPDDTVHQAFFGVPYGVNKHTMTACSFVEPEKSKWGARLKEHTRLHGSGGVVPASALSYLEFTDRTAAIVRRFAYGHSEGRGNAHVLIGPAAALDVSLSLGLANWDGWRSDAPSGRLDAIDVRDLAEVAGRTRWSPELVAPMEDELVEVLARLLDQPTVPLSVIGCPDQSRTAMVWGLRAAAGEYLRGEGYRRSWSYSTYEHRHDGTVRDLPEIVFLPEVPGLGVAHRTVVDLRRQPEDSASRALASRLVGTLLRGAPVLAPTYPGTDHGGVGPRPQSGDSVRPVQSLPVEGMRSGREVQSLGKLWGRRLRESGSLDRLRVELGELSKQGPEVRGQVRDEVGVQLLDKIAYQMEAYAHDDLLSVLQAVYGPDLEDLRRDQDAQRHAVDLIRKSRSGQLAKVVGLAARDIGEMGIAVAAIDRWEPGRGRYRRSRLGRAGRPSGRVDVHRPLLSAVLVAALVLLGAMFVFGYEMGSPEPAQQAPAVPTGEITSAAALPPEPTGSPEPTDSPEPTGPPQPIARTLTVTSVGGEDRVYGFIEVGKSHYPQQTCVKESGAGVLWRCEQVNYPARREGYTPELVAVVVPKTDVERLNSAASAAEETAWEEEWVKAGP
ncbi:hypothetical protein ACRAKI_19450 [Saccharothrix isguenensis]